MAVSTSGFILPVTVQDPLFAGVSTRRRRRISPQTGRALEMLGHAIEYLADEYVHKGKTFSAEDPEVKAVQLLMALNREIYFGCPEVPTLLERLRVFFHGARS